MLAQKQWTGTSQQECPGGTYTCTCCHRPIFTLECVQSIQSPLLKLWYVTSIQPMQSWLAHLGLALKNNVLLPGTFHHHFSES